MADTPIAAEGELTLLRAKVYKPIRRHVRYLGGLATLARLFLPCRSETIHVWVHDISRSGVGLSAVEILEVGSSSILALPTKVGKEPFEVPIKIIHCTAEIAETWRIGGEFYGMLTDEELDDLLF